jgi:DNA-binding transcriptional ArsR family regulator
MSRTQTVEDLPALQAIAHPVRLKMLELLREPKSAASLARELGEGRQKANYHLKELERGGFVRPAGERRKGNMTEQLYEAVAGAVLVSPRLMWSDGRRAEALRDQAALASLVDLGDRIQSDAAELLERAAYEDAQIPSAVVEAAVTFKDAASRSQFMHEYLEMLGPLLKRYAAHRDAGTRFRVALAVYPEPEETRQ